MNETITTPILVGTHATLNYPSDCYPLVVVSSTPRRMVLRHVNFDLNKVPDWQPNPRNPYPVIDILLTDEMIEDMGLTDRIVKASLRNDGKWYVTGTRNRVSVGRAVYHYNMAN